jgi:hypothetical protein
MPRLIPGQGNIHHRRGRKEEGERGTQRNATQRNATQTREGSKRASEKAADRAPPFARGTICGDQRGNSSKTLIPLRL